MENTSLAHRLSHSTVLVACSANTGEGLVKCVMCSNVYIYMDEWRSGTFFLYSSGAAF